MPRRYTDIPALGKTCLKCDKPRFETRSYCRKHQAEENKRRRDAKKAIELGKLQDGEFSMEDGSWKRPKVQQVKGVNYLAVSYQQIGAQFGA